MWPDFDPFPDASTARAAALKVWDENKDRIHLLITDMIMPDHMSGRDLAFRLHEDRPELPVVFITGYNPEMAGRDLVLEEGVNYVPKPFTPRKLGTTVRAILDRRSPSTSRRV